LPFWPKFEFKSVLPIPNVRLLAELEAERSSSVSA